MLLRFDSLSHTHRVLLCLFDVLHVERLVVDLRFRVVGLDVLLDASLHLRVVAEGHVALGVPYVYGEILLELNSICRVAFEYSICIFG